jgi:hypothetical protein
MPEKVVSWYLPKGSLGRDAEDPSVELTGHPTFSEARHSKEIRHVGNVSKEVRR